MRMETGNFSGELDFIVGALARCNDVEMTLIQKRLAASVEKQLIVEEVSANRKLEIALDALTVELAPISAMLTVEEYRRAVGQVRLGVEADFVARRLRARCERRKAISTTHVSSVLA